MVCIDGRWKPFKSVHSVLALWNYVRSLFREHAERLPDISPSDWAIDDDYDRLVQLIEERDPRSTFFRYPTTTDPKSDAEKSAMKEVTKDDLMGKMKSATSAGSKAFAFVVHDDEGDFVRGYVYSDKSEDEFRAALRTCAEMLYGLHAAMRYELCGGW